MRGKGARRRRSGRPLGPVVAAALLAACVGPGDLRTRPLDAGKSVSVERPVEAVLPAARRAVLEEGFEIESETVPDDTTRVLYARRLLSEREVEATLRVVVRRAGEGRTLVRVLSRRVVPTEIQLGGDPYVDRILQAIAVRFLDAPRGPGPEPRPPRGGGRGIS